MTLFRRSRVKTESANDAIGLGRKMLARSDVLISNSTRLISRDIPTRQSAISTRLADAWLIVAPSLRGHAAIRWGRTRIQVKPIYNLINQLIVTVLFPPNKDQAAHYINPVASPTIVAGLSFLVSSYLYTNAAPSPLGLSLGYSVLLIPSWHSAAAAGSAVSRQLWGSCWYSIVERSVCHAVF